MQMMQYFRGGEIGGVKAKTRFNIGAQYTGDLKEIASQGIVVGKFSLSQIIEGSKGDFMRWRRWHDAELAFASLTQVDAKRSKTKNKISQKMTKKRKTRPLQKTIRKQN